ncbi:MAG: hypothetical protein II843_01195 [Alphaproteobacteria bacterium]|nr:hypothetical protein [Alphaproteobacteria bacterium]
MKTTNRVYGAKHMKWLLTSNPLKIILRNVKYAIQKWEKNKNEKNKKDCSDNNGTR